MSVDDTSIPADDFFCSLDLMGKTTFLERFHAALTQAAVDWKSPTAVGSALGLNKQTVDRWLKGGEPTPAMLYLIADKLRCSPRWLATGEGGMAQAPNLTQEEADVIKQIYRPLASHPKALRRWIKDGHELVEITTSAGAANPFAKA